MIGQKELGVELLPGSNVHDLKQKIIELYPHTDLAMKTMLTAVNRVFSDDDTLLADQAEIAFFPHIAGG